MITVEPALFFYSLSMMSVSVIRDSVYFERACEDMGHEDCKSLSSEDKKSVQLVVSNFLQWNGLVRQIIPIILAFYIGAWSDKRGRKITLIFGLTGELIYSLLYLCFILNKDFPLSYFIFGVTIPGSIGGATLTTFSSFFSYVSDTSNVNNRTKLMTISSAIYSISAPIGVALGSYILSSSGSHVYVFLVNIFCIMIALVYSIFFLKWQTKHEQKTLNDKQIEAIMNKLIANLKSKLGAELR
jgi:PCFT/HCP family folate transporter-like MFS transporter 1/3